MNLAYISFIRLMAQDCIPGDTDTAEQSSDSWLKPSERSFHGLLVLGVPQQGVTTKLAGSVAAVCGEPCCSAPGMPNL